MFLSLPWRWISRRVKIPCRMSCRSFPVRYPYLKFIERGEMGDDLRHLYLNGESHFSFPEGLKKKIHEGDTVLVEAYMDPLAGGLKKHSNGYRRSKLFPEGSEVSRI